jgi:hypothetical protein
MNPDTPSVTAQPPRKGWWGRNWKWFVPSGCLTILLLAAALGFALLGIVFGAMKSSDAYKAALTQTKADPRVGSALGSPITDGFFVWGKTNVSGTSGQADMTVPISGPKGKGTIYFVATKFASQWTFSKLMVEVANTGQRIDLIEDPATKVP